MNTIKDILQSAKGEIIHSLQDCIGIPSVTGDKEKVQHVLAYYLGLAEQMGLKAINVENLGGVIEFGNADYTVGIIVHLDVVPEGTGWQYPPFAGSIHDNKIYGRGAIDDKGPAIAVLYALKAVKDSGFIPQHKIQIIAGIDEEDVWNTTPQLLKKIREPDFSFVPDAKFPLVRAEKGLVWVELNHKLPAANLSAQPQANPGLSDASEDDAPLVAITSLSGGKSLNVVPDYCEATVSVLSGKPQTVESALKDFVRTKGFDLALDKQKSQNKRDLAVIAKGKPAHAFACNEGINAISQMMLFLNTLNIVPQQKDFISFYAEKIGMEFYGESLGLQLEDEITGKLTVNPGFIDLKNGELTLKIDIRFPSSYALSDVKEKVRHAFTELIPDVKIIDALDSLNFPENDRHIEKLLNVYRTFSGDKDAKTLGMGGTTFAKAFKNAVAFGPTFPGMPKVEHQPDEYMDIDHLMQCAEIYAHAIMELASVAKFIADPPNRLQIPGP